MIIISLAARIPRSELDQLEADDLVNNPHWNQATEARTDRQVSW